GATGSGRPRPSVEDTWRLHHLPSQLRGSLRRLRGLEAGERDHLLGVRRAIETHDGGLAEHGFDDASRADRIGADRGAGTWPGIAGQDDPLTDAERGWRLFASAWRPARLRPH